MPGLDALVGLSSTAEQIFTWGVLEQIVIALMQPYLTAIGHKVAAENPNEVLTPAELAEAVLKGYLDPDSAAIEAGQSGLGRERFHTLVSMIGDAPGPEALAEALRRKLIPRDAGNADGVGYLQGIAQSRLRNKWADTLEGLDAHLPGPQAAVEAAIRNIRDEVEAQRLHELFGGAPEHWRLQTELAGEGPTPNEAASAAFRGIIAWDGVGPDKTSFEQAVAESRYKNKWIPFFRRLAEYKPPPRTITAMLREGSIDEPQATRLLHDYGVQDSEIGSYLTKARKGGVQKAHEITEGEIIRLYTERGIDAARCKELLITIRYSSDDADLIIAAADLEYQSKLTTATITAVKQLYLHRHIDANGAITRLDSVGVKSTYRDALLELWDLEIEAGVKSLTVKQILDYWGVGLFDESVARDKLRQAGYSNQDAEYIIAFALPSTQLTENVMSGANNPGP